MNQTMPCKLPTGEIDLNLEPKPTCPDTVDRYGRGREGNAL